MNTKHQYSNKLFTAYLLILCWAPLPLASNRAWSLSLLITLILLFSIAVLLDSVISNKPLPQMLKPYRWPLILFALVPIWSTIQILPLPVSLIRFLSPNGVDLFTLTSSDQLRFVSISLEPGRTQIMALFSWALWLFFTLTLIILNSPERVRLAFLTLVFCGVFQALYGSFMTLSGLEYSFFAIKEDYRGVATGTFVNRNHLAGYLEMCLAIGIGLLVATLNKHSQKGWRNQFSNIIDTLLGAKMRLRIFLALMVIALILTRSRMGNTAFFVSLPLCGVLMMILQRKLHKGTIILFVSLMLVDFFIVGQWFGFEELTERIQNTSTATETRDEVVRDTLLMLDDYSLTGTGLGTFYSSYSQYKADDVNGFYDHAHNDYLEFSTNLGIIGFIPLALSVLFALSTAISMQYKRKDQLVRGLAFAATMGMISLLIHSAVDFNLQIPANALLFVCLMAFAHLSRTLPHEHRD